MICVHCGTYFDKSKWNKSDSCENCLDQNQTTGYDSEIEVELEHLKNPSGKTPAVFYE